MFEVCGIISENKKSVRRYRHELSRRQKKKKRTKGRSKECADAEDSIGGS